MLVTNIFSFSCIVFDPSHRKFCFLITFISSSANAFNLDQSKILLFGKGLTIKFRFCFNSKHLRQTNQNEAQLMKIVKGQKMWWEKDKMVDNRIFSFPTIIASLLCYGLKLYHTMPHFDTPVIYTYGEHCVKWRNCL